MPVLVLRTVAPSALGGSGLACCSLKTSPIWPRRFRRSATALTSPLVVELVPGYVNSVALLGLGLSLTACAEYQPREANCFNFRDVPAQAVGHPA